MVARLLPILLMLMLAGCATVPQEEYDAVVAELEIIRSEADSLSAELSERNAEIDSLESRIAAAEADAAEIAASAQLLQGDFDVVLSQLGALREERLELQEEIASLEVRLSRLQSIPTATQASARGTTEASVAELDAPAALAAAIQGGGGFTRIRNLGLRNDARALARLSIESPGIAVDTSGALPILHDSRLEYEQTLLYLTITNPQRPSLQLNAQYTTDRNPLFLRTAFITIQGSDPVDPIDPIVLAAEPSRETNGVILREAITVQADRALINRLSAMISSDSFVVTFVGVDRRITHVPTVAERSALSNMLFAFIDLGGVR